MNIRKFWELGTIKVCALALALGLVACGDDNGSSSGDDESVKLETELADGNKVVCDDETEGVVAVTADAGYLKCEDGRWVEVSEDEALAADKIIGAIEDYVSEDHRSSNSAEKVSSGSKDESSSSAEKISSGSKGESSSSAEKISSGSKDESSSSAVKGSSSSQDEDASTLYRCDADGNLYKDPEECPSHSDGITSSDTPGTDPDVTPDPVPGSNSSSSEEDAATIKPDGYYSSNCPAGLTCKYATTTEYLNSTKTYGEILDIRDGQVYKTIEICDKDNKSCQTWMAQNLNYALDPEKVSSMGDNAWSGCYGDGGIESESGRYLTDEEVSTNCSKYGRLYTWEVAMNDAACASGKECKASLNPATPVQGVCPQGWHLPSHREFATLINYIDPDFGYDRYDGKSVIAGRELKSQSGWNPGLTISGNGTDAYGFSALPGGNRVCVVAGDCGFISVGSSADFWSSGEGNSEKAFRFGLSYDCGDVKLTAGFKILVGAVRCLRD